MAAVQAQDEKKVKEAIETFNQSVKDTITSLDALDVKAESIKSIKEQTKNVLSLASGLLVDQANMSFTNPTQTPEQQKAYAEKAEVLSNGRVTKTKCRIRTKNLILHRSQRRHKTQNNILTYLSKNKSPYCSAVRRFFI